MTANAFWNRWIPRKTAISGRISQPFVPHFPVLHGPIRPDADDYATKARLKTYNRAFKSGLPVTRFPAPEAISRLSERFPWMREPIRIVRTHIELARKMGSTIAPLPPLLLVGRSGLFKTRFARELANTLGRPVHLEAMAGVTEASVVTGSMRGFRPVEASLAARAMLTGSATPAVILDKLDKATGGGLSGHPHAALLPFLDRESAHELRDRFLEESLDASLIFWIATANSIESIEPALVDHFVVCEISHPSQDAVPHLFELFEADLAGELGASLRKVPKLSTDAHKRLTDNFMSYGGDIRRFQHAWRMALVSPHLKAVSDTRAKRGNIFTSLPEDN